ncbi:MAG: hypothetical protein ACXAB7_15705 [Candidatus Kariarchaeaceae archaeon]
MGSTARKNPLDKDENYDYKKIFFEYWDQLKIVEVVQPKMYAKIIENPIRGLVITVLADGMVDSDFMGIERKRHVLSASELLHLVNEVLNTENEKPANKANFYFHLQKLEDYGFITVVEQVPTGKLLTSYYGRTAKVFLNADFEKRKHYTIHRTQPFVDLIKRKNPEVSEDRITRMHEILEILNQRVPDYFPSWIEQNQMAFEGVDIDFRLLEQLVSILRRFGPQVGKVIAELAELLDIKQVK